MIYLDVNIFVYAAVNNGLLGEKCRNLLRKIINKKEILYTSCLTWDEFVYAVWKKEGKEKALIEGNKLLQFPNLTFLDASTLIIQQAQHIMEKNGLKPRDAIHATSAILSGCKEIVSDDSDFDKVMELKRVKLS